MGGREFRMESRSGSQEGVPDMNHHHFPGALAALWEGGEEAPKGQAWPGHLESMPGGVLR